MEKPEITLNRYFEAKNGKNDFYGNTAPYGAGDGIWTRDILVGNEALYHWVTPASDQRF